MIYDARNWARVRNAALVLSFIAWVIILLQACVSSCCSINEIRLSWEMLLAANSPRSLAGNWALMLVAMMTPMLVAPIYHIRISSFTCRRSRLTILFVASYGAVWMTAGIVIVAVELIASRLMPESYLPATIVALLAVAWQASPFKQRCLNRCHYHRSLAAFGIAADLDVLRFGLEQGFWCTGSCWATMLFSMLLPEGHLIPMAAVSLLMFCERLDPPGTPAWQWRGFGTAGRWLRIRLRCHQRDLAPLTAAA